MNHNSHSHNSAQTQDQILASILDWAHSLQNPNKLHLPESDEVGLANGLAGVALLPLTLSQIFPKQSWLTQAQQYFSHIAQKTRLHPLTHPGLYHGSCGLVLGLSRLAQQDERYCDTSQSLLQEFLKHIIAWNWQSDSFLVGQENFEVIGGAAGIIRVLLPLFNEDNVPTALEQFGSYFIWLSQTSQRWAHRPDRLSTIARARYPSGYIDLGMAHGLAGPLAALSLMVLHNHAPVGALEAITRWASWLFEQHLDMPWGYDWPGVLPMHLSAQECTPARTAWCYGTPGIARALWLAGRALADESLCTIAYEALASALRRQHNSDEPLLCHGKAGLLLICLRFAQDTPTEQCIWLNDAITLLCKQLCHQWQEAVGNLEPGFLTGATGFALTLLAALTHQDAWWDKALLLS